mmetsp:Transcript_23802/g.55448  ORF Transcript_23802/g.55448 Transcript_23802/m.55448 type:complete len:201 (-) Transcript_23802:1771-2373(-)
MRHQFVPAQLCVEESEHPQESQDSENAGYPNDSSDVALASRALSEGDRTEGKAQNAQDNQDEIKDIGAIFEVGEVHDPQLEYTLSCENHCEEGVARKPQELPISRVVVSLILLFDGNPYPIEKNHNRDANVKPSRAHESCNAMQGFPLRFGRILRRHPAHQYIRVCVTVFRVHARACSAGVQGLRICHQLSRKDLPPLIV